MSRRERETQKLRKKRTRDNSGSDSEHELYYYRNDRVRLMKEVLKTLKLKKIKDLAPDCIKNLDIEEMNTMLLEELLGISNKRLKKILEGQNADDESSSSDDEDCRVLDVDVISLDSISDDEILFVDETPTSDKPSRSQHRNRKHKIKKENEDGRVTVKREKEIKKEKKPTTANNEQLLSVLELLELQARARAIRSQLALEAEKKAKEEEAQRRLAAQQQDDDDDAAVVEVPLVEVSEIVISSSDSEDEAQPKTVSTESETPENDKSENVEKGEKVQTEEVQTSEKPKVQKIKLIRSVIIESSVQDIPLPEIQAEKPAEISEIVIETEAIETVNEGIECNKEQVNDDETENKNPEEDKVIKQENGGVNTRRMSMDHRDDDVICLDVDDMDGIED